MTDSEVERVALNALPPLVRVKCVLGASRSTPRHLSVADVARLCLTAAPAVRKFPDT